MMATTGSNGLIPRINIEIANRAIQRPKKEETDVQKEIKISFN
jgi:hypothetical protein